MLKAQNMIICIVTSNVISAIMVFMYCILQAPDIAITEAVIGTATGTILYALALLHITKVPTDQRQNLLYTIDIRQKMFVFILCGLFLMMLIFIIQNLPKIQFGTIKEYPRIATLYIKNAINDFGFSSIVTAVVAGYRAFDTMFENVVIFTACYGFYILWKLDDHKYIIENKNDDETAKNIDTVKVSYTDNLKNNTIL